MREIKFRFWHNGLRQFLPDYMFGITGNWILTCEPRFKLWDGPQWDLASPNTTLDITIQQYTGLKDKNGVKIYEGDILRWNGPSDIYRTGVVKYNPPRFEALTDSIPNMNGLPVYNILHNKSMVVGNIFEGVNK